MRRNLKFLMQAFVCLLVVNLWFAPASHAGNTPGTAALATNEDAKSSTSSLSSKQLQTELAEAKQLLQLQNSTSNSSVALAAFDRSSSQIHVVSLDKDSFLTKGGDFLLHSQSGSDLRVHIVRPNGVNTAVTVKDARTGTSMYPLTVKYPIEKDGKTETAFYVSAHPALISPELEADGRTYVMTMLNEAAQSLASKGVTISPDTIKEAAHLVIVEHTDHKRFLNDERSAISTEVLCLYALNHGDTYRYSVSSAGAGGMIQMIPRTYEAIRQHHPNVGLESDFVTAMQDHATALKAMLLYINDTWNYLKGVTEVQTALSSGAATKTELLAAGYNSNPYKLSSYLTNGGSGWRSLIPAETQMYLAIYKSVDTNVDFADYDAMAISIDAAPVSQEMAAPTAQTAARSFVSWVGKELFSKAAALTHIVP